MKIPKSLDWDLLRKFNMCSRHKSFSEASKEAGIHPPAFSNQMKRLESHMECDLFKRVNGVMVNQLTINGKNLLERSLRIENFAYKKNDTDFLEENDEIKIYTTNGISYMILPDILDKFILDNPSTKLIVINQLPPKHLSEGEVIIRSDYVSQKDLCKDLLVEVELAFFASKAYIEKYGNPKSLDEGYKHKLLYCYGGRIEEFLGKETNNIDSHIISSNIEFLFRLAQKGHGIVELPNVYPGVENLVQVFKEEPLIRQGIFVGFLKDRKQNSSFQRFIEFLNEYKITYNKNV